MPHRKDFYFFFHFKSMRAVDCQGGGGGQFAPKGFYWQDLSGGALDVATL